MYQKHVASLWTGDLIHIHEAEDCETEVYCASDQTRTALSFPIDSTI